MMPSDVFYLGIIDKTFTQKDILTFITIEARWVSRSFDSLLMHLKNVYCEHLFLYFTPIESFRTGLYHFGPFRTIIFPANLRTLFSGNAITHRRFIEI